MIPHLCATAEGIPFLRFGKPQSQNLSRVLGSKNRIRGARKTLLESLHTVRLVEAEEEDRWERLVRGLLRRYGTGTIVAAQGRTEEEPMYEDSVLLAIEYISLLLDREREDGIARAKAMLAIVQTERALAEQEATESV